MTKKYFSLTFIIVSLIIVFSSSTRADWSLDTKGNVVSGSTSQVLGDSDKKEEPEKKEEKKEEPKKEEKKESEKKQQETKQEQKKEVEKNLEKKKESQEQLIMKKDDIDKVEIDNDKNGLQIKATDKKGEVKIQGQKEFEMQIGDEQVKISTEDGKTSFKMKTRNNEVEIKTDSPLSINPATKGLTINTPSGEKSVTILPDKAAEIVSKLEVIDNSSKAAMMKLETEDNKLVYKIVGTKQKKLFGFMPVTLQREAVISAETGSMIKTNESVVNMILNFLSL